MQATRERLHREGSIRARANLRCSVCHGAIENEYIVDGWRNLRICLECDDRQERA